MTDLTEQLTDLDTQIQVLVEQKALLTQQAAEDPQRTASRDEVAALVAGNAFWGKTINALVSTALHPDWATLDIPLDGVPALDRAARLQLVEQLVRWGGSERGYSEEVQEGGGVLRQEVPGRVLLHRERAEGMLKRVAEEYGW